MLFCWVGSSLVLWDWVGLGWVLYNLLKHLLEHLLPAFRLWLLLLGSCLPSVHFLVASGPSPGSGVGSAGRLPVHSGSPRAYALAMTTHLFIG